MGMLKVKGTVRPRNLVIAAALANAAHDLPFDPVITSGNDSQHMPGSKHYTGEALDVRTRNIPADPPGLLTLLVTRLKRRLGPDYQVIVDPDHLHIERDA